MEYITQLIEEVESTLTPYFKSIDDTAYINQAKVLDAFHAVKVSESDLQGTTG